MKEIFYDTVTVGERGQIVIPARARKEFGIKPKDKLIVLRNFGKPGLILIHAKQMSSFFEKITRHISQVKKILSKQGKAR
jgi:AbrB family looped-hinge helix DNA binding protein